METFSALLALCSGNPPVTGEFPAQRPVTRNFDVLFDLRLNKWLSKQSWGWWSETSSSPLWCHGNGVMAWCFKQTNYYPNQCYPSSMTHPIPRNQLINSSSRLWPSDAIWRHRDGSTLATSISQRMPKLLFCIMKNILQNYCHSRWAMS